MRTTPSRTLALCALAAACSGSSPPPDGGDAEACMPSRKDAGRGCPPGALGTRVFITETSDYEYGALESVGTATGCAAPEFPTLPGDTVLAWHGHTLVALGYSASGQDNLTFLDVSSSPARSLGQVSALIAGERGTPGNARAFLRVGPDRGYVARFNRASIAVVDTRTFALAERPIDLSAFAANGSSAYPIALASVNTHVWVAIERLPPGLLNPTEPGVIAVIDPTTDALVDLDPAQPGTQGIELPRPNPTNAMVVRGNRVWVACPGSYERDDDGAVVELDAAGMRVLRELVTDADLRGNADAVLVLDDDRLLVRVVARAIGSALDVADTRLVEWTVSTRSARTWLRVPHYALTVPILTRDGHVYVGDRGDEAACRPAGIRVFDAATGSEITREPIATGLPPYDLREEPEN